MHVLLSEMCLSTISHTAGMQQCTKALETCSQICWERIINVNITKKDQINMETLTHYRDKWNNKKNYSCLMNQKRNIRPRSSERKQKLSQQTLTLCLQTKQTWIPQCVPGKEVLCHASMLAVANCQMQWLTARCFISANTHLADRFLWLLKRCVSLVALHAAG